MIFGKNGGASSLCRVLFCFGIFFSGALFAQARPPIATSSPPDLSTKPVSKKGGAQDDSFVSTPASDLALQPENVRKANALADFVEGTRLEENAAMDNA